MTGRVTDLSALVLRPRAGDTAERRACARGELVRLAPGRFVEASTWHRLHAEDRAALKALAVVPRLSVPVVVSHLSAAALPVEEVVVREKRREDRLRAVSGVRGMVRSTWRDLRDPAAFGRTFVHAGLPRVRPSLGPGAYR